MTRDRLKTSVWVRPIAVFSVLALAGGCGPEGRMESLNAEAADRGAAASMQSLNALPLLQRNHMVHMGAFAPPDPSAWSGRAMAAYSVPGSGALTLYFRGHDQRSDQVAQISVPPGFSKSKVYAELPVSRFIQPWTSVTDGELDRQPGSIGDDGGNGAFVYGLLVHNERLVIAATTYYSSMQDASHGVSSLNLSERSDFRGFFRFSGRSVTFPRAMGGALTSIPAEWQTALGGKALAGNAPVSIISSNSFGPAMTVFDPDTLGRVANPAGHTVLFYPQSSPLCGEPECEQKLNPLFTWASGSPGLAFVPRTRSVLAIGVHPVREMWYGGPISPSGTKAFCDDGGSGQKAAGMEARVLAYDALSLYAVKTGSRESWSVKPYAIWQIPEVESPGCWDIVSSTFEPQSGLLFVAVRTIGIAETNGLVRIEVFRVSR